MSNLLDDYSNLGEKPPRPLGVLNIIQYLFTGCPMQLGFLLLLGASILFWIFGIKSEIIHGFFLNENWVRTEGRIKLVADSGAEINDYNIYRYEFTYEVNGQEIEGKSHSTRLEKWYGGEAVTILYDLANPSRSTISGMRTEIFDYMVGFIFVMLPILIATFLILWGLLYNILFLLLLKYGVFIIAKTSYKEARNPKSNYVTYTFKFEIEGINYQTSFFGLKSEEGDSGRILYLPLFPKTHTSLAKLTSDNLMDKFGKMVDGKWSALAVFTLPIIAILINLLGWSLY